MSILESRVHTDPDLYIGFNFGAENKVCGEAAHRAGTKQITSAERGVQ
jgi:hypothetical protein